MNHWSQQSKRERDTCHPDLQEIADTALQVRDCSIPHGYRSAELQDHLFATGRSEKRGGESKHNFSPSLAIDLVPYPEGWDDREALIHFAGIVKGIAYEKGIDIRWGGDWDQDGVLVGPDPDEDFEDFAHFELV